MVSINPLAQLIQPPPLDKPTFRWGFVTSVSPSIQITLDGDTAPLASRPSLLTPIALGDRIYAIIDNRRATVIGRVPVAEPIAPEPVYQSYTPSIWGTGSTTVSFGNSTVDAWYIEQPGGTVHFNCFIEIGSTFNSNSTGNWSLGLPVMPHQSYQVVDCHVTSSSVIGSPAEGVGNGKIEPNGLARVMRMYLKNNVGSTVTLSGNSGWVTGDDIIVSGTYRSAA